jgi:hypothetical protein
VAGIFFCVCGGEMGKRLGLAEFSVIPALLASARMENFRLLPVFVCWLVEQEFIANRHRLHKNTLIIFFIVFNNNFICLFFIFNGSDGIRHYIIFGW